MIKMVIILPYLQNFEKEKEPEQDTKIIFILNNVHPIGRFQHENRAFDDIIIGEMKEKSHFIKFILDNT